MDIPTYVWLLLEVLNEVISLSHADRRDLCNPDTMLNDNHSSIPYNGRIGVCIATRKQLSKESSRWNSYYTCQG